MKFKIIILSMAFLAFAPFANADEENIESSLSLSNVDSSRFFKYAILQVLDKTTAKTSILKIKIRESHDFGRIKIKIDRCWQAPLDQKPDSRILLEIFEKNRKIDDKDNNAEEKRIFYGWMIASSPSLASLEHPVYDVIAINCKNE